MPTPLLGTSISTPSGRFSLLHTPFLSHPVQCGSWPATNACRLPCRPSWRTASSPHKLPCFGSVGYHDSMMTTRTPFPDAWAKACMSDVQAKLYRCRLHTLEIANSVDDKYYDLGLRKKINT
uniref:Uncharacterized protein n=1 Tax=Triticum urartu TaxID=4572 RepID=A0A8R7Q3K9_TRIUA